jgi:hypothetical protein
MGDMGEAFRDYAQDRQQKRRENTKRSTDLLKHEGVSFDSRNGGAHLIVAGIVDFYPGTGLFIPRDRQYGKDRGVFRLLKFLRARRLETERTCRE